MRYRILFFPVLLLVAFCMVTQCRSKSVRDILIITDIGTDVDDALAICLAIEDPQLNISGIACTGDDVDSKIQIARTLVSQLGHTDIPIGSGASFVDSVLSHGNGQCDILLISQATLLSEAIEANYDLVKMIDRIYFQGLATIDSTDGCKLMPDPAAYNVSEDIYAAQNLFNLQDMIPFTIVGKYSAYPLALSRQVFESYALSGEPAGVSINQMAIECIERFAESNPDRFRQVYNISDEVSTKEALDTLEKISCPYDAVAVLAMTDPDCFTPITYGKHLLIGVLKYDSGIISSKCKFLQERLESLFLSLHAKKITNS